MDLNLTIPAFIAGILTFLAPCTLPLVPGYLAFISGVSLDDLSAQGGSPPDGRAGASGGKDSAARRGLRRKVFLNGLFYVIGFSIVFIVLGSLFGLGGAALIKYRLWLSRIGGVFVIFFGLFMLGVVKLPFLLREKQFAFNRALRPGNPLSSLIFGATFAFGWTPCIGPVLGSVLVLASSSTTVFTGALLLAVFAAGLAVPFLAVALGIGSVSKYLGRFDSALRYISAVGGIFLIVLGVLLIANQFGAWIGLIYRLFDFLGYDKLLNYL